MQKQKKQGPPVGVDPRLMQQAAAVASNLVGFPCEIVLFDDAKTGEIKGYRIQPDLGLVEFDITVYSYLKEFAVFYMQAHQHTTGLEKLKTFNHLIPAIFDYGAHWQIYRGLDPGRAQMVLDICAVAIKKAGEDIARLMEEQKKG